MKSLPWVVSTPFAREHFGRGVAAGKAEGLADGLLTLLRARGLKVSMDERERILSCGDIDQLKVWIGRAVVAKSTAELFASA